LPSSEKSGLPGKRVEAQRAGMMTAVLDMGRVWSLESHGRLLWKDA
jgi:hypothetical protein